MKKRIKVNIVNISLFIVITSLLLYANTLIIDINNAHHEVSELAGASWIQSSSIILNEVMNDMSKDVKAGELNPLDDVAVNDWMGNNIPKIQNVNYGHIFLYDIGRKKLLWSMDSEEYYTEKEGFITQSIVIPPGKLGFNDEKPSVDGAINPEYRQFLAVIQVSEQDVLKSHKQVLTDIDNMRVKLYVSVSVSVILYIMCMLVYAWSFRKDKN
jgi:hypothetical protein